MYSLEDVKAAKQQLQETLAKQAQLQTSVEALHAKQLGAVDQPEAKQAHQEQLQAAQAMPDKHERLQASIDALHSLETDLATTPEQQRAADRRAHNLSSTAEQLRQDERQDLVNLQRMKDQLPANVNLHAAEPGEKMSAEPKAPDGSLPGVKVGTDGLPPTPPANVAAPQAISDEQIQRDFNAPPPPPPPPPPEQPSLTAEFNEAARRL